MRMGDAIKDGVDSAPGQSIVCGGGAVVACCPHVLPEGVAEKGKVGSAIRVGWRGRVSCLNGGKCKVTIAKNAPCARRGGLTELSNHAPELMGSRLRASWVPRCIESDDAKKKPTSRGGGNHDIKRDDPAGEPIRNGHMLAVEVMSNCSNYPSLRRTWRGSQGRHLVKIIARNEHARGNRRRRLRFIHNPNIGTRRYNMALKGVRFHHIVQAICIN